MYENNVKIDRLISLMPVIQPDLSDLVSNPDAYINQYEGLLRMMLYITALKV